MEWTANVRCFSLASVLSSYHSRSTTVRKGMEKWFSYCVSNETCFQKIILEFLKRTRPPKPFPYLSFFFGGGVWGWSGIQVLKHRTYIFKDLNALWLQSWIPQSSLENDADNNNNNNTITDTNHFYFKIRLFPI